MNMNFYYDEVEFIEKIDIISNRYDITVEDNHNFFANDILVHNCQNCFRTLQNKWMDYTWERTLKLDGSSMTMYCNLEKSNHEIHGVLWQWIEGVCSRNLDLKTEDNDGNVFIELWKELHGVIYHYCISHDRPLAFQMELMGSGIQGNRERFQEHKAFVYDIFDITKQEYLPSDERLQILSQLGIESCPVLGYTKFNNDITVKELLAMSDIPSINNPIAEGVVYKSVENPQVSFKVINNKFLLQSEE